MTNFTLNDNTTIPVTGFGVFMVPNNGPTEEAVTTALKEGYRQIFVTTKMWTSDYDDGEAAVQASLDRLGLDYIDLMILHHSQPENDVQAYQAMEKAVDEGKLRSIGLSNYYETEDFDRLVNATSIKPALLQNETHPYHQSKEMQSHIAQYGTVLESWFPLGGRGNTQTLFDDPTISAIAAAHGKTSAQIILLHRSFCAGTCRQGILQFPVRATPITFRKTARYLTLS